MIIDDLQQLFARDIEQLMNELNAYPNEEALWVTVEGISNSAGNLFMHLCGNLQHFIGSVLLQTGYVRDREYEFSGRRTITELREEIMVTKKVVLDFFHSADETNLKEQYPLEVFGYQMSISYFLIHLHGHLEYHKGQINYHRRILLKSQNEPIR